MGQRNRERVDSLDISFEGCGMERNHWRLLIQLSKLDIDLFPPLFEFGDPNLGIVIANDTSDDEIDRALPLAFDACSLRLQS
ncbi:hypothetical protein [Chelativorans sp. J32]|uniref:hypothetical protein n=1 Tax=Chelativorans sp. J32 TaxID=935840 RepID=UPI0004835F3C|nr:hypothetical protein [Chelativorans sp. J32]